MSRKASSNDTWSSYKVGKMIGSGATACVYSGKHKNTKKKCALKIIRKQHVKTSERLIHREISVLSSLSHPNIATLQEWFWRNTQIVIVMERAQGTLLDLVNSNVNLDQFKKQIQTIVRQISSGLVCIHRAGYVHRDIKLANILIYKRGVVKISDFGLAITIEEAKHSKVVVAGTVEYIPPECFKSDNPTYNENFDIWSLGILTLRLLMKTKRRSSIRDKALPITKDGGIDFDSCYFDAQVMDFLRGSLNIDPNGRFDAMDCLKHQWLRLSPSCAHQKKKKTKLSTNLKKTRRKSKINFVKPVLRRTFTS